MGSCPVGRFHDRQGHPLLIAILGLATALATAWGAFATADKIDANEDPPADTGDTNDGPSSSTVTTPEQPRDSSIFRETGSTPVTFSSGYSIELDATDADWGVEDSSSGDLYFYLGDSGPFLSTGEISLVDHIPTEVECDDATVLQTELNRGQTRVGAQMCMRTSEDRLSYVHIANIDEDNRTITLDIVVWE